MGNGDYCRCQKIFDRMEKEGSDFGQLRNLPNVLDLPTGIAQKMAANSYIKAAKYGDPLQKKFNRYIRKAKSGKIYRDNRTIWLPNVMYPVLIKYLDQWEGK